MRFFATRLLARVLALLACALLAGCYFLQAASAPVAATKYETLGPYKARGLVVFLPGMLDGPEDFVEYGFLRTLRAQAPGYDAVAVNLHFGYYRDGSFVRRLHNDVIVPARKQGYRQIWIVGISLGGFGALGYAYEHSDLVTGVIALAPYLGDREVVKQVEASGLCAFQAGNLDAIEDEEERFTRSLWAWLAARCSAPAAAKPPIYLGYGREDRMGKAARLLFPVLPPGHRETRPGGHKWVVWRPLFAHFAQSVLAKSQRKPEAAR